MALPRIAKIAIRSSVALTCAAYAFDDWRFGRRLAAGRFETDSGRTHTGIDLGASLDYIETVHRDYCAYACVERFTGTVAEIGPGDNFGVALMLLGHGADAVHAIDRYYSRRDPDQQHVIYEALSARHGLSRLFDGVPSERTIRGLTYHVGEAAETFFSERGLAFDAVLSRAVMEHLYDPIAALDGMWGALRPGGVLVHRIDLRDHGMFRDRHPLTFLTVPDPVYVRMTRHSGRPNRVLLPRYRAWAAGLRAETRFLVSRLVGVGHDIEPRPWHAIDPGLRRRALAAVAEIRPRLAASFADTGDEDLAVAGFVLVARRPGAAVT